MIILTFLPVNHVQKINILDIGSDFPHNFNINEFEKCQHRVLLSKQHLVHTNYLG